MKFQEQVLTNWCKLAKSHYWMKLTLQDILKKIVKKHAKQEAEEVSTLDNSLPSTSSQPDVLSPVSTFPLRVKAVVPVAEDAVMISDEGDYPDSPSAI